MKLLIIIFLLLGLEFTGLAQERIVKDKNGKTVGYIKKDKKGNETFYDKSHNKQGSSKKVNKTTYYYDKYGKKVYTTKQI